MQVGGPSDRERNTLTHRTSLYVARRFTYSWEISAEDPDSPHGQRFRCYTTLFPRNETVCVAAQILAGTTFPPTFWPSNVIMSALDLWNPQLGLGIDLVLITAFMLGVIHGITPDEHTWPITFSYSIGSYSTKGGMRAGLLFSTAFTLQRAIASEIAYFGMTEFAKLIHNVRLEFGVDLVVGIVMLVSGYYVLRRGTILHLFHSHKLKPQLGHLQQPHAMPAYMPLVHGFIAGWGSGAFALITYTVLAPSMPNAYLGFVPGLLFGLGTMVMQILFGALVGAWMARRHLGDDARIYVARAVAGRTLSWGGFAFIVIAILGLLYPDIDKIQIDTGIQLHNLAHLGIGFLLVVVVLFVVAVYAFVRSLHEVKTNSGFSLRKTN